MTDRLKRLFSIFHVFILTISNCFCQCSYERTTRFHSRTKRSYNFILFHKDLRSRTLQELLKRNSSLTHRNLSKDNLLYHNHSESKYLWQIYLTNLENSIFFPFYASQNLPPKRVVFSFFLRAVSLSKISRSHIFLKK